MDPKDFKIDNSIISSFDEPCRQLLDEIKNDLPVEFLLWNKTHGASRLHHTEDNSLVGQIFYYDGMSMSSFAHELLHLKLGFILGQNSVMYNNDSPNIFVKKILDFDFCQEFGNQIEHYIMYKDYLNLGYESHGFFSSETINGSENWSAFYKLGLRTTNGEYVLSMVEAYFNAASHFMFYPQKKKYRAYVKDLEKIDPTLFKIFNNLFQKISKISIRKEDANTLQQAYKSFTREITDWIKLQKFYDKLTL